jgi:hypothetical protein
MDFPRRDIDRNKDQRRGHSVGQLRAEIPHWIEESPERTAIHELLAEAETAERREAAAVVAQHHQERQWWTRFSAWVGVAGFLLALAAFLLGRFWPTSQVSELERRVATLEPHQRTAMTNPPPTPTPSQVLVPPPVLSLPVPSTASSPAAPAPQAPTPAQKSNP